MNTYINEVNFQNEDMSTADLYGLTDYHFQSEIEQMCAMNDIASSQNDFLPVPITSVQDEFGYRKDIVSQSEDTSVVNFYDLKNFQDQPDVEQICELNDPNKKILKRKRGNKGSNGGGSSRTSKEKLSFELISQYFYMRIEQAAKELGVGLQPLRDRCRELGIDRWPGRKLRSMQYFLKNAQELGRDDSVLAVKEMKKLEKMPDLPLEQDTLRLRDNCIKTLHKRRKSKGVGSSKVHKN